MMKSASLRVATPADWTALTGMAAPGAWIGLAYEEEGRLLALGAAFEATDGRWWVSVTPGVHRPVALMRGSREVVDTLVRAGVTAHALANPAVPGAERFLERIGFERSGETIGGHMIWRRSHG